ncbi:MAG TPA: 50S ribosomal protein L13 [Thermomicrobiales bacterium]|nr:50S ribosomal protein L13 [Thermomicrobiales bacterium]
MERRTWSPKGAEAHLGKRWYIVDAEGQTLGRLASVVAATLRGKNKPTYAPHMDMGDYVVVVNAEKVALTGKKETQKFYYRHSQYPGGLHKRSVREVRQRHPTRLVEYAVRGMLPKTLLGERQLKKLKVYAGPSHPHESQLPEPIDLRPTGSGRQS